MTFFDLIIFLIVFALIVELLARVHYYIRKQEFSLKERIKLIFFGRWLVSEIKNSPLYIDEIAHSLNVDREFMLNVLKEASGKDLSELNKLFLTNSGRVESYDYVPLLGFLPSPNLDLVHTKINNLGFRGQNRDFYKPANVKRVILLGGSVLYGRTATSETSTIAAQLEKKLNCSIGSTSRVKWEVINLSVPDFISYQELLVLTKYGLRFNPDIVLSFSGINDVHHYLMLGEPNESASLTRVKTAYTAFFGPPIIRFLTILSGYFISIYYLSYLLKKYSSEVDEELSPFIYTIW